MTLRLMFGASRTYILDRHWSPSDVDIASYSSRKKALMITTVRRALMVPNRDGNGVWGGVVVAMADG